MLDTFNRPDESPLAGGWVSGVDMFGRTTNLLKIVSNQVTNVTAGNSGGAYWNTSPSSADQYADIRTVNLGASGWVSPMVRLVNAGTGSVNGYMLFAQVGTDTEIYRLDAGSSVLLVSGFSAPNNGDTVRISITGTVITAFLNGASVGSYDTASDATKYSAAGQVGLLIADGVIVDDFDASPMPLAAVGGRAPTLVTNASVMAAVRRATMIKREWKRTKSGILVPEMSF